MNKRNMYRLVFLMIVGVLTTAGLSSCCSKRVMVKYGSPQGNYQQQPEKEKQPGKIEKGTEIELEKA